MQSHYFETSIGIVLFNIFESLDLTSRDQPPECRNIVRPGTLVLWLLLLWRPQNPAPSWSPFKLPARIPQTFRLDLEFLLCETLISQSFLLFMFIRLLGLEPKYYFIFAKNGRRTTRTGNILHWFSTICLPLERALECGLKKGENLDGDTSILIAHNITDSDYVFNLDTL